MIDVLVFEYMTCFLHNKKDDNAQKEKPYFEWKADATTLVKGRYPRTESALESEDFGRKDCEEDEANYRCIEAASIQNGLGPRAPAVTASANRKPAKHITAEMHCIPATFASRVSVRGIRQSAPASLPRLFLAPYAIRASAMNARIGLSPLPQTEPRQNC
jgi:hypothetical protein